VYIPVGGIVSTRLVFANVILRTLETGIIAVAIEIPETYDGIEMLTTTSDSKTPGSKKTCCPVYLAVTITGTMFTFIAISPSMFPLVIFVGIIYYRAVF
jgi:hypothetical protein